MSSSFQWLVLVVFLACAVPILFVIVISPGIGRLCCCCCGWWIVNWMIGFIRFGDDDRIVEDVKEKRRIRWANVVIFERQLILIGQTTAENPTLTFNFDVVTFGRSFLQFQESRRRTDGPMERSTMRRSILYEEFYAAANEYPRFKI